MKLLLLCLVAGLAQAQTAPAPPAAPVAPAAKPDTALGGAQQPDGIRGVMTPSLDKQKESVRKQVKTAQPVEPGWFTVPWPSMEWTEPV
ncbi:MAG: hypothetical protein J0L64_27785, partial [Acidobacteria bacterium]|nr:hypothetical protein [Acidobacteriota bacterium]